MASIPRQTRREAARKIRYSLRLAMEEPTPKDSVIPAVISSLTSITPAVTGSEFTALDFIISLLTAAENEENCDLRISYVFKTLTKFPARVSRLLYFGDFILFPGQDQESRGKGLHFIGGATGKHAVFRGKIKIEGPFFGDNG